MLTLVMTFFLARADELPECRFFSSGWYTNLRYGAGGYRSSDINYVPLKIYQRQRHGQCAVNWDHVLEDCRAVMGETNAYCDHL